MARCRPFREDFGETGWLGGVGRALNQIGRALNLLTLDGQPYEYAAGGIRLTSGGGDKLPRTRMWDVMGWTLNDDVQEVRIRGGYIEVHTDTGTIETKIGNVTISLNIGTLTPADGLATATRYVCLYGYVSSASYGLQVIESYPESGRDFVNKGLWIIHYQERWKDGAVTARRIASLTPMHEGTVEFVGWRP